MIDENDKLKRELAEAIRIKNSYYEQLQKEIKYWRKYIFVLDCGVFKWLDGGDEEYFIPNELNPDEINTFEEWEMMVKNNEEFQEDYYQQFFNL